MTDRPLALVELQGVSVQRGVQSILDDVSLAVAPGEPLAILGASGAGKSTLLRVVAGLDEPQAGRVLLRGSPVSEPGRVVVPPHRRGVAMVFQDLALWPTLSPLGNVRLGLAGSSLPHRAREERARVALDSCGIGGLAHRELRTLSGGERQRVALARALAGEPSLLLLDEPFTSLDVVTRDLLLGEVRALAERRAITLLVVSHERHEVDTLCTRAAVLEAGRLIELEPVERLRESPRSTFARAFFAGPRGNRRGNDPSQGR